MTEAVDCATTQLEAEESGEDGQVGEAAEGTSASKMQFQDDTEPSTSNDVDFEEEAKCPYCHTVKEPSFEHYRSGRSGLKKGAVIWRYRCSMRQCTQFFGPLYRYNSKENSFDIIAEDDPKVEMEETNQAAEDDENDTTNEGGKEDMKLVDIETVDGENAEEMNERAEEGETEAETTNEVVEENDTVQEAFGLEIEVEEEQIEIKPRKSLRCTTNRKKTGVYASANQEKKNHNNTKNGVPKKKLRKGYVWESISSKSDEQKTKTEPVAVKTEPTSTTKKLLKRKHEQTEPVQSQLPKAPKTVEREREKTRMATKSSGTQTGDADHVASASLQELIQMEASLTCGTTQSGTDNVDMDASNSVKIPGHITRRMLIGKMIVAKQNTKIASLEEENARFREMVCKFREAFFEIKNSHVEAMRHLKDDVIFLKREFQFHHDEMVAECKRSLNATKKEKEDIRRKCEVVQQQNDSLKSLLEIREERVDMERKRADELARQILLKERDQHLAEAERDEANGKLADSLFLANNVKCALCVNSTKMKEILTLQVKEKTIQVQQAMNERNDMRRKLENADKISQILHKDRAKFEYEAKTWKSSYDKLRSMLAEKQSSADPQSFAPPCVDPTPQPLPSTPTSISTPSIDTPNQQSSANGNENSSATPQPSAAAGTVTDDSPPEDGEISNSPMTVVSSKSRSPG
ncbi:hypothetical protein WR25_19238 [Diploscapter pachys]|uniref:Uncharacterized protein n=1 Tax=Diploscapter pachys TaxID=2018661 RepID=A0A2A2LYU3_9BILA|nr:hypothetical protein WR25_19238 [Diploscapter pachys]